MEPDPSTATPPQPARNPLLQVFGIAIRAPLGCFGFLAGMVTVVGLAVPTLLSSQLETWLVDELDSHFYGRFEVDEVQLAYLDYQRLDGFTISTPKGEELATLDVQAPSVLSMLEGGPSDLGSVEADLWVDLVRFEDGSWNWQQAFETESSGDSSDGPNVQMGSDSDPSTDPLEIGAVLGLDVQRLRVEDRRAGGPEELLEVVDLRVDGSLQPGMPTRFEAQGTIVSPRQSALSMTVDLGYQPHTDDVRDYPFERVSLRVDALSMTWLDAFLGTGGKLGAAVGADASLDVVATTSNRGSELNGTLSVSGPRGFVRLPFRMLEGRFELEPQQSLEVSLFRPARLLDLLLPEELAERYELELGDGPWRVTSDRLSVPLDAGTSADALLRSVDFAARAEFGDLMASPLGPGRPLELGDLAVELELIPGERPGLVGGGSIGGGGRLALTVDAPPLDELMAALGEGRTPDVTATLSMDELALAVADGLLASKGLLTAVLGQTMDLEARLGTTGADGELAAVLDVVSPLADVELAGRLVGSRFVVDAGESANRLEFDLRGAASDPIVGPLVPLLAQVETVPDGRRAVLALERMELPLDGDLSAIDGALTLDLGDVRATWLSAFPGLASIEDSQWGPYRIQLQDGRAIYEGLPLSVDGTDVPLTGSVSLATRELALSGDFPLRVLGSSVGELASSIDPEGVFVPVQLTGSWPQIGVDVDAEALAALAVEAGTNKLRDKFEEKLNEQLDEQLENSEELRGVRDALDGIIGGGLRGLFGRKDG